MIWLKKMVHVMLQEESSLWLTLEHHPTANTMVSLKGCHCRVGKVIFDKTWELWALRCMSTRYVSCVFQLCRLAGRRRTHQTAWSTTSSMYALLIIQSTLDISNSDISNSAKLEAFFYIKNIFLLLSSTIIWHWRLFYKSKLPEVQINLHFG